MLIVGGIFALAVAIWGRLPWPRRRARQPEPWEDQFFTDYGDQTRQHWS